MKRLVISSAAQLVMMLNSNPDLINIPVFAQLKTILGNKPTTGCSRCQKRNIALSLEAKTQAEQALSQLTPENFALMKGILKVNEICYYHLINGKMNQTCI